MLATNRTPSKQQLNQRGGRSPPVRHWFYTLFLLPLTTTIALPILLWRYHHNWHDSRDETLTLFETAHRPKTLKERVDESQEAYSKSHSDGLTQQGGKLDNTLLAKPSTAQSTLNSGRIVRDKVNKRIGSAVCAQQRSKFHVWLYTLVDCDFPRTSALLPHWLSHYRDWRFKSSHLLVVVHQGLSTASVTRQCAQVKKYLKGTRVNFTEWTGDYSTDEHLKVQLTLLHNRVHQPQDWVVVSSVTELHEYGDQWWSVQQFLKAVGEAGATWVKGQVVERVSRNKTLSLVLPQPSVFQQFPLDCNFSLPELDDQWRVVAFKAFLRQDATGRSVVPPTKAKEFFGPSRSTSITSRDGGGIAPDLYPLTPYHLHPHCYADAPTDAAADASSNPWSVALHTTTVGVFNFRWHVGMLNGLKAWLDAHNSRTSGAPGNAEAAEYSAMLRAMTSNNTGGLPEADCQVDEDAHNRHAHRRLHRSFLENST